MTKEQEELLKGYENKQFTYVVQFSESQLREIRDGIEHGLTPEQIAVYANPTTPSWLMERIRIGLEDGLSIEGAQLLTDCESRKEVKDIDESEAWYEYPDQFQEIIDFLLDKNHTLEQAAALIEIRYDYDQIYAILKGYEAGLTDEQMSFITNPEVSVYAKYEVINGLTKREPRYTTEQAELVATPGLSSVFGNNQVGDVCNMIKAGKSVDEIKEYIDSLGLENNVDDIESDEPDTGDIGDE